MDQRTDKRMNSEKSTTQPQQDRSTTGKTGSREGSPATTPRKERSEDSDLDLDADEEY